MWSDQASENYWIIFYCSFSVGEYWTVVRQYVCLSRSQKGNSSALQKIRFNFFTKLIKMLIISDESSEKLSKVNNIFRENVSSTVCRTQVLILSIKDGWEAHNILHRLHKIALSQRHLLVLCIELLTTSQDLSFSNQILIRLTATQWLVFNVILYRSHDVMWWWWSGDVTIDTWNFYSSMLWTLLLTGGVAAVIYYFLLPDPEKVLQVYSQPGKWWGLC